MLLMSTGIYEELPPQNRHTCIFIKKGKGESYLFVGKNDASITVKNGLKGKRSHADVVLEVNVAPLHQ